MKQLSKEGLFVGTLLRENQREYFYEHIEYEPIETAWIPISGKNYELWVAGTFKGKGIGKELLEYAKENNITINFIKIDSLEKAKNVPCIFNFQ